MIIALLTSLLAVACVASIGWLAYRLRDALQRVDALEARLEWLEAGPKTTLPEKSRAFASKPPKAQRVDGRTVASRTLIAVPDLSAAPSSVPPDELLRRYGSIWDLAEGGTSPESIARETGQPIGQVELILGLKNPRAASGSGLS